MDIIIAIIPGIIIINIIITSLTVVINIITININIIMLLVLLLLLLFPIGTDSLNHIYTHLPKIVINICS
jgi:hypothetical protein